MNPEIFLRSYMGGLPKTAGGRISFLVGLLFCLLVNYILEKKLPDMNKKLRSILSLMPLFIILTVYYMINSEI